ncbi:MFS transporter [Chamaesiphon sp. VAR_48_metabat_403]|uniref:MFS transporter n=1 Tax=Chamaesiphon sp. VAR_48_metabat_403 TaxID=2964700 RepID=UPI00286E56DA|nr:MFS transporter [Chamaesiphon sp. VAR_48_metabat_403]
MDLGLTTVNVTSIESETQRSTEIERIPTTEIRRSLVASSIDGVFAAIYSNLTSGVLLSNFLIKLQANSFEVGILAAIPMLANVVQPLGAWWGDRAQSRRNYCASVNIPARCVWILLAIGIALYTQHLLDDRATILWTMVVVSVSHLLGGLGSATWLSWMADLVPSKLRGRYFSIRNTAANLTSLIVVAIAGFWVANYPSGEIEAYQIALGVAIVAGIISMFYQWQMVDISPSRHEVATADRFEDNSILVPATPDLDSPQHPSAIATFLQDRHFLGFTICFSAWMFALNLSAPFFNLYLLQDLEIDVSWVTLYNSLTSAANLALLIPFGRWSDRIGTRIPLVVMGLVMAVLPLLWLGVGKDAFSLWLGLPLLFILNGGASAAIDLCINNLQIEIAHDRHQAQYFGINAALGGISGFLGTCLGGILANLDVLGGLTGLFVISSILRLFSLVPLLLLQLEGEKSLFQLLEFGWLGLSKE